MNINKTEIQQLQNLYNQWVKLYPQLEASLVLWQQAETLLKPLAQFYGSAVWQEAYDHFNEPLDTQGNFSVLSEDALWNAFSDHAELYQALKTLLDSSVSNRD